MMPTRAADFLTFSGTLSHLRKLGLLDIELPNLGEVTTHLPCHIVVLVLDLLVKEAARHLLPLCMHMD